MGHCQIGLHEMRNRKGKKAKKAKAKGQAQPQRQRPVNPARVLRIRPPGAMMAYARLLADPCGGRMTTAPYAGAGSGYLIRTVDQFVPTVGTPTSTGDFIIEITPWNFPNVFNYTCTIGGGSQTVQLGTVSNFVTNTNVVKCARPVACCAKWVPLGPYNARQGLIGLTYAPSKLMSVGDTGMLVANVMSQCVNISSHGSIQHEVLWLPSFADERFSSTGEQSLAGVGTMLVVGRSIDFAQGATSQPQGYLELTTVWEWEPQGNSSGTNIPPSVAAPPAYSLNQVLSSIGDLGRFTLRNAKTVASLTKVLTGGVGQNSMRGSPMLIV